MSEEDRNLKKFGKETTLLLKAYSSDQEIIKRNMDVLIPIKQWPAFHRRICSIAQEYGVIIRSML